MSPNYKIAYAACPLCESRELEKVVTVSCASHPLYREELGAELTWLACQRCGHIFTDSYYSEAGLKLLFANYNEEQVAGGDLQKQRLQWAPVVERMVSCLPAPERLWGDDVFWLDVGCGNGSLVFLAHEYGFKSFGVDTRQEAIAGIHKLGYQGFVGDLNSIEVGGQVDVVSLADVLEHVPFPAQALQRVWGLLKPGGLLFVSMPNLDCVTWRAMDQAGSNPYWSELEHHHNFSRRSLARLLAASGFSVVSYGVSTRYIACMEIIACKPA